MYHEGLWRSRAKAPWRWTAIVAAFVVVWFIGLVVIGVILWLLNLIGAPTEPTWAVWLGLGALLTPFVIRSPSPGFTDGEQAWTDYVVRCVVIGEDEPRPVLWRVGAVLVFGPGLAGYAIVYGVQALLGLV